MSREVKSLQKFKSLPQIVFEKSTLIFINNKSVLENEYYNGRSLHILKHLY